MTMHCKDKTLSQKAESRSLDTKATRFAHEVKRSNMIGEIRWQFRLNMGCGRLKGVSKSSDELKWYRG